MNSSQNNALLKTGFSSLGHFHRLLDENFSLPLNLNKTDPMALAILEAMNAAGRTAPNPAVGCVIVKNGSIIAQGATEKYKFRHAERVACDTALKLKKDLVGADFFVTLEPCAKIGNQPPCLDLLLSQKPNSVTIAAKDPDVRTNEKSIKEFTQSGIKTSGSELGLEALVQNLPFMISTLKKRPYWTAKWAESKDGQWFDPQQKQKWITKPKARAWSHGLRQRTDAIVVGAQTFLMDQPTLTTRECAAPRDHQPVRIVVDPKSRMCVADNLTWKEPESAPWIWLLPKKDLIKAKEILGSNPHVQIFELDVNAIAQSIENLPWQEIQGRSLQSVMVEGGIGLFNLMRDQNLIFDCMYQWIGEVDFGTQSKNTDTEGYELLAYNEIDGDQLFEWIPISLKEDLFRLQFKPVALG